jgi:hypothetical protein
VIDYGPIRVRHRRYASQTLATGRRSKNDRQSHEDPIKCELRRTKNRLAARELKKCRDNIEIGLMRQIQELEQARADLQCQHKQLEARKASLSRAVYNAKQAPLIPLVVNVDIPVLLGTQQRPGQLIDIQPLLRTIDDTSLLPNE